jgi:hypothetical protein
MSTPAVAARFAQIEDVASLVLVAEQTALAEVERCSRQALRLVAESRLQAEWLHKRTEARIERVRQRMKAAAQARQVEIAGEMAALAGDPGSEGPALELLDSAITLLAEELAGVAGSS